MSGIPIFPPSNVPPVPPSWHDEEDWMVLIAYLREDDPEDRTRGAEAIGYLLGYARQTDTRMLALAGNRAVGAYKLLFSFPSRTNKVDFLKLVELNDVTACLEIETLTPTQEEISAAHPIAFVLPGDVLAQIFSLAAMLSGDRPGTIQ